MADKVTVEMLFKKMLTESGVWLGTAEVNKLASSMSSAAAAHYETKRLEAQRSAWSEGYEAGQGDAFGVLVDNPYGEKR